MILLVDIGNTHTHLGLADARGIVRHADLPTAKWTEGSSGKALLRFAGHQPLEGAALCSVVPRITPLVTRAIGKFWNLRVFELRAKQAPGIGIDYPRPETIGADRLANAVAARATYGAPVVVVDFGTAVTFDVVNPEGNYAGGIIAPGLSAMTSYLHEKTALLPKVTIREVEAIIGKSTEEAMLIGAVHGYRGLIRELIRGLKKEMGTRRLPVIATGGYAGLISNKLAEITEVNPLLTLEGLRLAWTLSQSSGKPLSTSREKKKPGNAAVPGPKRK